jgi:proteasome lid subunit RPN8/RPN11
MEIAFGCARGRLCHGEPFLISSVTLCLCGEMVLLMLKLSPSAFVSLRQHGEETYPHECCGVLLGRFDDDGSKTVSRVARCVNARADSPHNRYHIDPKELIHIQREGRERGEDIVGFYHSHPDHPAQWSTTDLAEAHWIGCSYVITSVEKGTATVTNSFELTGSGEDDKKFVDEKTEVV